MSDAEPPSASVVTSLGIDPDSPDIPISDDFWKGMLDIAFDPSTPPADSNLVPSMDDSGDLPDVDSDDVDLADHVIDTGDDAHDAADHGGHDHGGTDHGDVDPGHDHSGTDWTSPDVGGDHHDGHVYDAGDDTWHV